LSATPNPETPDQGTDAQAEWDSLVAERSDPGSATAAPETPDPIAQAPDPQESAPAPAPAAPTMEQLLHSMQELQNQVKRAEGRVSSLQSDLAKQRSAPAEVQPTTEQVALAIEDPEEWKKLQDEFPEWGVAIQKKLDATTQAMLKRYGAQSTEVKQEVLDAAVSQALEAREYARLERAHPAWKSLTATPAYQKWFSEQPAKVQALAESPYSEDAIAFFDKFKTDTGGVPSTNNAAELQARRQQVLQTSATTTPRRPAAPRAASDQDLTAGEIWAQELARRNKR
jgi:hypothetical protein